jgi:hypothetical protein
LCPALQRGRFDLIVHPIQAAGCAAAFLLPAVIPSPYLLQQVIWYNKIMTQTGEILMRLSPGDAAPDFTLPDHNGTPVTLSAITQARNALLVFNIGFA